MSAKSRRRQGSATAMKTVQVELLRFYGAVEEGLIRLMRAIREILGCGSNTNRSEVGILGKCCW